MATTRLTRTQTAGTRTKATLSTWVKRGDLSEDTLYTQFADGTNFTRFRFTSDTINCNDRTGGSENWYFTTNAVYTDTAAWYHVVISIDTTQATDTDRVRCWINGVLQTFASQSYPTQDANMNMNQTGQTSQIGANELTADYFDGVMAHTHWTDGYSYVATDFGEFDSTSGIWVAKSGPSVSYGTNGFFLKYASGALGTDSSGESNDFTVTGTMTTTKDTPDNNFATLNLLDGNIINSGGLQNGGTTYNKSSTGSDHNTTTLSTQGVSTGKWYWEVKATNATDGILGFINSNHGAYHSTDNQLFGIDDNSYGWRVNGTKYVGSSQTASFFNTYTDDDILSFAIDLDNGKCYAAKNGVWENSGDPTSGATGTGSFADPTLGLFYSPAVGNMNYNSATKFEVNYGNGYFGTTAVSTSESDDAGIGSFEYDVPAGYYAICTTNLGDQS